MDQSPWFDVNPHTWHGLDWWEETRRSHGLLSSYSIYLLDIIDQLMNIIGEWWMISCIHDDKLWRIMLWLVISSFPYFEERWLLWVIVIMYFKIWNFKRKKRHTHISSFSCRRMFYLPLLNLQFYEEIVWEFHYIVHL